MSVTTVPRLLAHGWAQEVSTPNVKEESTVIGCAQPSPNEDGMMIGKMTPRQQFPMALNADTDLARLIPLGETMANLF